MDDELFKNFINKVNEIFVSKETVLSFLLLLLLLSSLLSFNYKLELELKPLLAIYICFLLYLPT